VLAGLLDDPEHRLAAAEALSRIEDAAGLPTLLERSRDAPDRDLDVALALAVRRHLATLPAAQARRVRVHLREDSTPRGLVLGALARDPASRPRVLAALTAPTPVARAQAALAAALLGDRSQALRDAVVGGLLRETDALAFRALASAALSIGARIDPARIDARWLQPSTAPEALWLTAANLRSAPRRVQRRARRAMRRALRAAQPRVRAGAAVALALARDRAAWRALAAALDDEAPRVRLAADRALGSLAVPEATPACASHARTEVVELVRAALADAAEAPGRRPRPAILRGDEVLYVRVSTAPGIARGPELAVDVMLDDGRWLRTVASRAGEVLIPDLPAGAAEVQPRLDR